MFILAIFAAWILGSVGVGMALNHQARPSLGTWAVITFVISLLIAALATDVKYTAFFGAFQRNDGAISYISLAILCMAAMMSFGLTNLDRLKQSLVFLGIILSAYGLLQSFGHDPLKWNSLYGPVVGTLGNPDFFSATLGVMALATVWYAISENRRWVQVSSAILVIIEVFAIKRSGSFQGLVAFAFGFAILAVAKIWQFNRRFGIVACVVAGVGSIPVFAGMLNVGPLAAHIYRASLRNRVDYWHSALGMFRAHPLVGVGLDRLGDSYAQYAPQIQVVQGQSTDNAHNVFLQLMATGGLVVTLPYLFLLGVIFIAAWRGVKAAAGQVQIDRVALFALWLSLLLISSVSIDNLGVAVWFWILGGVLYAVSQVDKPTEESQIKKKGRSGKSSKIVAGNDAQILTPIFSTLITVVALVLLVPAWNQSAKMQNVLQYVGQLSPTQFGDTLNQIANTQPNNVQMLLTLGETAAKYSQVDLAKSFAKRAFEKDPRSNFGNNLSAALFESSKTYQLAIPFRVRLLKLDPWNTKNMLQLVADYTQIRDLPNARRIAAQIATLFPNGIDAKAAAALIKG